MSLNMLASIQLTSEQQHVMEIAFNHALRKLDLIDRSAPVCAIVAQRLLQVHQRGVTNAVARRRLR